MTPRKKMMKYSGMTMVEIMVGVIIMALVLIPSLNVIINQTQTVSSTRDHLLATFMGQKIIEIARTCRFEYLAQDHFPATSSERLKSLEYIMKNDPVKRVERINDIDYRVVDFKITEVKNKNDLTQPSTLALLSFAIEYTPKDGKNHRLDISTAIAQQE
ncbi:MAG: hypothetical protein HQM08_03580 [Candidatus Riflebacteria bacterium]|nr:hypothetical protein [Candidatus Riflebacteria bacterium]